MTKIKLFIATFLVLFAGSLTMNSVPNLAKVNLKELECLTKNVYYEARGEPISGQFAVAAVTVNRVRDGRFSSSVCKVVYETNQFSWVKQLKSHSPKDKQGYLQAKWVAHSYLTGAVKDPTDGATHYHTTKVRPYWRTKLDQVTTIGNHHFYKIRD